MNHLARLCRALAPVLALGLVFPASNLISSAGASAARRVAPAPAAIDVNSTADVAANDGQCTLREAITSANADAPSGAASGECAAGAGDDTVTFSVTGTINLAGALPDLSTNVALDGPGAKLLTVRRNTGGDYRVFNVTAGATVGLSGMTVSNGRTPDGTNGTQGGRGGDGGGIKNSGTLTLTAVSVSGNRTGDGGDSSQFSSNGGDGGTGGGVYNDGTLVIVNSTVSGNQTGSGGTGGRPNADGNAGAGGGVYSAAGTLTATNSTFSGNSGRAGGGIWILDGSAATLTNCTIAANFATSGGNGIASFTFMPVANTIIANNGGPGTDASGIFDSKGHNVVGSESGSPTGCCVFFTKPTDQIGTADAPLDAKLGPLADNGGQTLTHAPLAGSPALDAGNNALALDASNNALTTDQRGAGFPRIADAADADITQTVDVGAFEAHPSVENIADQTTNEETPLPINFNVGDAALGIASVTATSDNTALVPNDASHVSVTGSGSTRTLTLTPAANLNGLATVTVIVTGTNGRSATDTFQLTVAAVNDPPSALALSNSAVADNSPAGTDVGTLSTTDPDAGDSFTYALVAGAGGADNGSFTISGSTLKTSGVFDFETKPAFAVRVRSTDSGGASVEQTFVVTVTDGPDSPGALSFSSAQYSVGEAGTAATITLTRTGGADNRVWAKVSLADVTTSPADYVFAPGALDTSFATGAGANGHVRGLALQPDGKVIIVGAFATYNGTSRAGVARVNADGSLDTSFNPGTGTAGSPFSSVWAAALQPDGKVIIGGLFNVYNGTPINGVARLNVDGSLDTSFNVGTGASDVRALALQPDGKLIIGGLFTTYNGTSVNRVARLNSDGSLDTSFNVGTGADEAVKAIALQPDGKVFIAGEFTNYNGTAINRIARLNANGSLDTSFNVGTGVAISPFRPGNGPLALALQPDGKLLIGGGLRAYNGTDVNGLARVNPNGSLDTSFNASFTGQPSVSALALQPDGKVVAGAFSASNSPFTILGRLNANGSSDTSFNTGAGPSSGIAAIAFQPDGRIVLGGFFTAYDNTPRGKIARVNGDLYATWAAGDTSDKTVSLPVVNDTTPEPNETLSLSLTPFGGAAAGARTSSTLTILDNDALVSNVSGTGVYAGTATLTATLSAGGAPLAGKSVSFTLNGTSVGSATTNASGVATLTSVSLAGVNAGTHATAVGASFAGDAGLTGGTATGPLTVAKADQTITFGVLADKTFGDADFNVTASASSGLTVAFSATGQCTVSGGSVHLTGAGACTVSASQPGDGNYNAAAGVQRSFQIAKAATATAVNASANPSGAGQSVTFSATVTSLAGTPTGTVQFKVDGTNAGAPSALNAGGVATFTTSGLAAGAHAVTAEYGGDSNFNPSAGTLTGGQTVGSVIEFGQSSYNAAEGGTLTVTVRRTGDTTQASRVDYATDDGSVPSVPTPCSATTGLALDRCDYTKALGTLLFAPGDTEKTFDVLVGDDSYVEGPETFGLRLSNPTGDGALGAVAAATVTVADDSPETSGNPIDDDENFVRQHYLDFLNREPDAAGLAFWTSGITVCGSDAQCREVKRIDTSAAFFLSIEFQETGFLAYRAHKAAFGDATSPGVPGTVPVVRLDEFLKDTRRIGEGVVVNVGDWLFQLEANKNAYMLEFVRRQRFTDAFPATMTPTQFVDALNANAGGVLDANERADLINELTANNTSFGRASVLRKVAEDANLAQAETNRAFVLMQYFGYLRRNPDEAPERDLNFGGWKFWLGKLEEFDGDYRRAEMVKAFLSSAEYRQRFGR
jgi:uncharacterized delta-60 repeat protein/CSLREA domain-containing protein